LWVTEVHHLIEQFIDNDKVVANTFLLQDLEILREHLHDFVEKEENLGRIGVFLCQRKDVKVAVTDVEILNKPWCISKLVGRASVVTYPLRKRWQYRRVIIGDRVKRSGLRGWAGGSMCVNRCDRSQNVH
jgi:hypothetical protein